MYMFWQEQWGGKKAKEGKEAVTPGVIMLCIWGSSLPSVNIKCDLIILTQILWIDTLLVYTSSSLIPCLPSVSATSKISIYNLQQCIIRIELIKLHQVNGVTLTWEGLIALKTVACIFYVKNSPHCIPDGYQGAVSLRHFGGKITPKVVWNVLLKGAPEPLWNKPQTPSRCPVSLRHFGGEIALKMVWNVLEKRSSWTLVRQAWNPISVPRFTNIRHFGGEIALQMVWMMKWAPEPYLKPHLGASFH
jgi:hypothetical protein